MGSGVSFIVVWMLVLERRFMLEAKCTWVCVVCAYSVLIYLKFLLYMGQCYAILRGASSCSFIYFVWRVRDWGRCLRPLSRALRSQKRACLREAHYLLWLESSFSRVCVCHTFGHAMLYISQRPLVEVMGRKVDSANQPVEGDYFMIGLVP